MRKVFYSLILFACFFFGFNNASAYTLENEEIELLKCYYGGTKEDWVFTVLKTNKRIIVDNPDGNFNDIKTDILISDLNESAGTNETSTDAGCPAAVYYYDDENKVSLTKNMGEFLLVGSKRGEEVTQESEKECSINNYNIGVGEDVHLIIKKKYGVYYYKIWGYGFDSGDLFFEQNYTFDYSNTNFTVGLSEENKVTFKKYLDADDKSCPTAEEFKIEVTDNNESDDANFEDLLKALKNPMQAVSPSILTNYALTLKSNPIILENIEPTNEVCDLQKCETNPKYYAKQALSNVMNYCDKVYANNVLSNYKVKDCVEFVKFYSKLVEEKLIDNYAEGCGFISTDLRDKLVFVLNLIKIVGPIAAIFLGMLDFVKAVMSGDPDKESKTAFKRLKTRLIAAVLLFIIPLILGFLMDLFLSNDKKYGKEDPFCNLVKWEE